MVANKAKSSSFFYLAFLSMIALWIPSCGKGSQQIIPINSFNEVNFQAIKLNSLVIFDVDETLVQPTDMYLINIGAQNKQAQQLNAKLMQKYPQVQNWEEIVSIATKEVGRPLIEPDIIPIIRQLQERGIPVIACTSMNTGAFGVFPSMEQWRYEHLKSLGFEGSYPDVVKKFETFKRKPVFYKGILATDTEVKGPAIGAFLNFMNLHPQEIVMFDDDLDYLRSVQEECVKRGIAFKGYQYKRAIEKPWDEKLAELQADYLIQNKKWLSDQEAMKLLEAQK